MSLGNDYVATNDDDDDEKSNEWKLTWKKESIKRGQTEECEDNVHMITEIRSVRVGKLILIRT